MKYKTAFFCRICGTEHSKWQGQCKSCKEWNSLVEEKIQKNQMSKRVYNLSLIHI